MTQEKLFASFMLDKQQDLEIALKAQYVTEATHIQGSIQKLPGSLDFIEGFMHLRNDVIPVINLKKRLGLESQQYSKDAKVAVIDLYDNRYGLLFEDIKEVFRAQPEVISPISTLLQTEDQVISALIKLEPGKRAIELLDLNYLFGDKTSAEFHHGLESDLPSQQKKATSYSRFVIFDCGGQEYGIPVDLSREITFCDEINEMYKTDFTKGALDLRGNTIPILNTHALLTNNASAVSQTTENTRILILDSGDCKVGLIVDEIKEILSIPEDKILPFPEEDSAKVTGMFARASDQNTILLNVENLICDQIEGLKSMARIGSDTQTDADQETPQNDIKTTSHHLITENCYLVFSIGKNFAIELKDVKEIIENTSMMNVPGVSGYRAGVINLRGEVVPVINLRNFYRYGCKSDTENSKLIICSAHGQTVALEVDQIVTIYKQEQYHTTPSLNKDLNDKKDTLDRLIEYLNDDGIKEHVLVVNTHSLIRNHLQMHNDVFSTNNSSQNNQNDNTKNLSTEGVENGNQ